MAGLLLALVLGCTKAPEPPVLTSVTPDRGPSDRTVTLTITGERLGARLFTDFSRKQGSALDSTWTARLGREALLDVGLGEDGTLHATVPAGLAPGPYELTVVDPAGRALTLADAYRVLSIDTLSSLVDSYRFDPVPPQRTGVPFAITVTALDAQGAVVDGFSGAVTLSDRTGAVVPRTLAWFAAGRWTGPVEVRVPSAADALTATDADGRAGVSNDFSVGVGPGAGLRFSTPPRTAAAGTCSEAVSVELTDTLGLASAATTPVALTIAGTPSAGFELFSDATCATPLAAPVIAVGQSATPLFFRGTRAGTVQLRASAPALVSAVQAEVVSPGPAVKLSFTTPPPTVTAGACSPAVTLAVQDAFDNLSPVTQPLPVSFAAVPNGGFTFFTDPTCGTAGAMTQFAAGSATIDVSFIGNVAGVVVMTASATGLPDATQTARINPEGFPTRLVIVSAAQTLPITQCSGPLAVQTQDSLGNAVSTAGVVTVALSSLPLTGLDYFLDDLCLVPTTTLALGSGGSTDAVYFRGRQTGAVTALVDSAGLQGDSQTQTLLAGPPDHLAIISPARTELADTCSAEVVVQLQDMDGFATPAVTPVAVTLSAAPATGFTLYSDASCTTPASALTLAPGATAGRLWFKGTRAGAVTLDAASAPLGPAQQVQTILPAPPAGLAFLTAPQTVSAAACSAIATVQLQDAFGNPATQATARPLNLAAAPAAGFTFYSDPGCTTPVTLATLAAGATEADFFFSASTVGPVTVTVSSTGLTPAQQVETVQPGVPASLAFTTAPQTRAAGSCSGIVTVEVRDAPGNPSTVAALTTVTLAALPVAGFAFYSDASCATAVPSVTIAAGLSNTSFFFRGTLAQPIDVTASSAGLASATQRETLTAGPDAALLFTTPPRIVNAGACSAALTVGVQDAFGNAAPQAAARAVALSAAPGTGFTFYSDAGCTTVVTGLTIGGGASSGTFFVRGTTANAELVTAQSAGVTNATQTVTVTAASTPSKLAFTTPPRTVTSAQCSAVLTVQSLDSFDNPRTLAANTPVVLSAVPAASFAFYSDAACTVAVANITIAAGTDTASFYARGLPAGAVVVTAAAAGLNPATQTVTITAAPADRLVFTTPPQTLVAGACSALATVQSRDAQGNASPPGANTTVTLTSGAGVTFFSDATCTTTAGSVTLASAATSTSFYFRGTVAGTRTLTASAPGFTAGTQNETINPAAPSKLIITSAPLSVQAGACSAAVTVQVQDPFNNPVTLGSALPVTLSQAGVPVTLYSGACGAPAGSITIGAGASSATFTLRGTTAGVVTVTTTSAGLTPASQAETINPAPGDRLVFTTPPQTLTAGACSAVATVQVRDPFGNAAPVGALTTVTLSAPPPMTFFTAAGCGTSTTTAPIAAGASATSFFFRGTLSGAVLLTATAPGLTPGTQSQTINPGAATAFQWDPLPPSLTLTVPFAATIRARDAFGNTATSFTQTAALSLAPVATTVACTAACTNATTTDVFTAGVWTGTLTLGGAVGTGRAATATQGAVTGTSALFDVVSANRSPPTARFTATPRVVLVNQVVTFDASTSADLQTPTAMLQVSWDFDGVAAGPPPWTAWTTTKTATRSWPAAGIYGVRLAVRDTDGDIGFRVGWVHVLPAASTNRCVVDINTNTDDGATSCANKGPDNRLSLVEAVRVSNSMMGTQTITFNGPMTITGTGNLNFTADTDLVAPAGVIIVGFIPQVTTNGADVRFYGLELSGQTGPINVSGAGASLEVYDSYLHNGDGINNRATLLIDGTTFAACTQECINTNGGTTVRHSLFRSSAFDALRLEFCGGGAPHVDAWSNVFSGVLHGIHALCTSTILARHNTFDANEKAVWYAGGTGQVLTNNLITGHTDPAGAVDCTGGPTFTQRTHHLLRANATDGCGVAGDPSTLTSNPLYVLPASFDYRLTFGSPGLDAALDLGLNLTPAAPGNFQGAGPDRGGRESY
ncbi:MAG: right-handed parallel beta-helix repeat-containing protein [Archangium sp.]|nr:right-handed parallel beta-helix repeat-containing protein [Archangium sp.]